MFIYLVILWFTYHLQIAKDASEKVINSGEHSLYPEYFDLFQYAGEGRQNKENIFITQHGISVGNDIRGYNAGFIINWGNNITKALVDAYLMDAEATFELQGNLSDADLNLSINLVRERVGMPELTNELVEKYGLEMREEIRRERRIELAVEGFRYWDIIRWKIAEEVLPEPVLGSYYFEDGFGTGEPNLTEDNYILVQKASTRAFNPQRDYLWPFPVEELALNKNLVQNPGW